MKHFFSTLFVMLVALMGTTASAWVVSGNGAILNGQTWNHTSAENTMTKQADGSYKLVVENCILEVGSGYEWLITDGTTWIKTGGANAGSNFVLSVPETGKYTVTYTLLSDESTASAEATKTGEAGDVTHTYSVAGTPASIFGAEWDQTSTATDMTLNSDGLYEWTSAEFTVEGEALAIAFKVVLDHAWGEAYPASDYTLTAPVGGPYRLVITFDKNIKTVNAEIKGESVRHDYSIAGSHAVVFGAEWDETNTATDMILNDHGTYAWTSPVFTLTDEENDWIEFKVVQDHSWSIAFPDENYATETLPRGAAYTLTVTFDPESKAIGHALTPAEEITVYSVAGANTEIFGAEWDETNTATEMALGADGIYTWTSGEFSYAETTPVEFKVVGNHKWAFAYPTENYYLEIPAGGPYVLTVTFDPATATVGATYAETTTHIYSVVGNDADLFGAEWDVENIATEMTLEADGMYHWTSPEFTPTATKNLEFKVALDHTWDVSYPASNYVLAVAPGATYRLNIAASPTAFVVTLDRSAEAGFYLIGNANTWNLQAAVAMAPITTDGKDGYVVRGVNMPAVGDETPKSYFSFISRLASTPDDWDGIADARFGAEAGEGDWWVLEEQLDTDITLEAGTRAFAIDGGTYDIFAFPADGKMKVSHHVSAISDINAEQSAPVSVKYYTLTGVESNAPLSGINIVVSTYSDGSRRATKIVK